jgi:ribonuclease Z
VSAFELLFLGTAASVPSATRGLPALLVGVGSERLLVDCGEGTQRQLMASGAGFRRLRRVFLTHAHLDHVLGLPGLVATLGLFDAATELTIYGGPATLDVAAAIVAAALGPRPRVAVRFEPIPGPLPLAAGVELGAFPVPHGAIESIGYRFRAPGHRSLDPARLAALGVPDGPERSRLAAGEEVRLADGRRISPQAVAGGYRAGPSLAVIGDCGEVDSVVPHVAGADLLVVEATYLARDRALARSRHHLTAGEAASLARDAGVGRLLLTHLSGRYELEDVLKEARAVFPGAVAVSDFDRFHV